MRAVAAESKTLARFAGPDGADFVSIDVTKHRAFAAACVAIWRQRDGQDRRWMLEHKAVSVPASLLSAARAHLEDPSLDREARS